MLYDLSLHITYEYDTLASGGHHVLRLMPLTLPDRQRLIAGSIRIDPSPDETSNFTDFFEHPVTYVQLRSPHERLDIRMQARVAMLSPAVASLATAGEPMEAAATPARLADLSPLRHELSEQLVDFWSLDPHSPHHFLGAAPLTGEVPEIALYAGQHVRAGMTIREIAETLCRQVHADFTYDSEATTVETPARQAFRLKRGVCQDFSHILIIALRSLGIPAGYVSGFLRTIPPPGKPRLEGADAMHAWVRIWCGTAIGWIELDPTNNVQAGTDHVVVAYGRDYSDVAPVIGVLKTYGSHTTHQAVDVVPLKG